MPHRNALLEKCLFIALLSLAGVLVLGLLSIVCEGEIITVDVGGNADHETIQDAVNASENGDTIQVWDGIYWEQVTVNKSLSLVGNGSASTTIAAKGMRGVVNITANWVNISGFSVSARNIVGGPGIVVGSDNNHVFNNTCHNSYSGIFVTASRNNSIANNSCSENFYGIYVKDSVDCSVDSNSCSYARCDGILLINSSSCRITGNNCFDNDCGGIQLSFSTDARVENNHCASVLYRNRSLYSLWLGDSRDLFVSDNRFFDTEQGVVLARSLACTLRNNSLINESLNFEGDREHCSSHHIDTSNTVNGKPLFYYANITGITVSTRPGPLILAGCNEITVSDQNCSNSFIGLLLVHSSAISIENSRFDNNVAGIELINSDNCSLVEVSCKNNEYGIVLSESPYCGIMNSSLEANGRGIYITHSPNCTITRCSILGNETGIFLLYSDACKLINNICSFNAVGVHLYDSSNCSITNNRVSDNGVGIALNYLSKDNTVQFNEIHGNTWSGMNSLALNNDYPINASNNWWGHDSGPYHADNNPGGRGDNVSDGVDFAPWTRKGEGETEERRPLVYLAVVLIVLVLAALLRFLIVHLKRRKPVLAHKCENNTLGRRGTGW